MTKAEIIRKLAKRAGITDLDAKVFFEAFLRKAILRLKPGDSVKVNGFGYFQRRTGKVKNSDSNSNTALADLVVFYPFRDAHEEGNENLIFDVPAKTEEPYNLIDAYFSISFGKPVIPLKDANLSEFYIPPVGNELIRLIEMRAEKLLDETEVVENFIKGNDILLIDSGVINPNQMEINWEENNISHIAEGEIITGEEANDSTDSITWDFGEDLDKQIKEESILDTSSEDKLFVDYDDLKGLNWEFGIAEEKENEQKSPFDNIESAPENKNEYEKPVISGIEKNEDVVSLTGSDIPEENEPDEFKRVDSFTSRFNIEPKNFGLTKSEMDLSWTFGQEDMDEDSALLKSITQEINDEGFAEVKYHKRKYKFETDISEPADETPDIVSVDDFISPIEEERVPESDIYPDLAPVEKELEELNANIIKLPAEEAVQGHEAGINSILESYPSIADRTPGITKKKGLGIFVITALVLVLCGSIFLYYKMSYMIAPITKVKKTEPVTNIVSSITIERDFDIPVNYPYLRDNSVKPAIDPFTGNLATPEDFKETKTPDDSKPVGTITPKVETKTGSNNLIPVKLKEFIYKSGDKFIVQVSSWPSEPKALNHAAFFKNKGFDTQIEKAYLGRGYWYRVLVGYFNTESEAEKFKNKYK